MKVSVIGAGTWGTALSIVLAKNKHDVYLWSKFPEETDALRMSRRHHNLPGAFLPNNILMGADIKEALKECELMILAVPSIYVRETSELIYETLKDLGYYEEKRTEKGTVDKQFDKPIQSVIPIQSVSTVPSIVTVSKGIEDNTFFTMSEIAEHVIPGIDIAVLSGPSHAEEVSRFMPTTVVTSSRNIELAQKVQDVFMNEDFRVYLNDDWKGVEIGAALKNVVALAAGISDGLRFGDNAKAALITRGIAEIARLGVAMGCHSETFSGLSGIGDLIVTCASVHSRNRQAGVLIGKGLNYKEAMKEVGQIVEGVYAAKTAKELSKIYNVEMPIVQEVNDILFGGEDPRESVRDLMLRVRKYENQL